MFEIVASEGNLQILCSQSAAIVNESHTKNPLTFRSGNNFEDLQSLCRQKFSANGSTKQAHHNNLLVHTNDKATQNRATTIMAMEKT